MELHILGSGTSHGVPVISCNCAVCCSKDPHDTRYRSSALICGDAGERILIDCGPEFRLQAVRERLSSLDALLLTHAHADHLHGLDDVRPLTRHSDLPIFGNKSTIAELKERFAYLFMTTQRGGGKAKIQPQVLLEPVMIGSLRISPIPVLHGTLPIYGWLIEDGTKRLAYLTDLSELKAESERVLQGIDVLVVGALRTRPHPTHLCFDQAFTLSLTLDAKKTYLTHLCHDHLHTEIGVFCDEWSKSHPRADSSIEPAWDGLVVRV
ncbi:MBL fold metallo-hydrolase [Treponema sp.]